MNKSISKNVNLFIALFLVIVLTIIDQLTKYLAITQLKDSTPHVLIKDVFELQYLENRGAAFGVFQNKQWIFIVFTFIVLIAVALIYVKTPLNPYYRPIRVCVIFITAGAIGNMIDRIYRNFVVDFLYFKLIDFPVFNVADIYVTLTIIILCILILFKYKENDFNFIFPNRNKQIENEGELHNDNK